MILEIPVPGSLKTYKHPSKISIKVMLAKLMKIKTYEVKVKTKQEEEDLQCFSWKDLCALIRVHMFTEIRMRLFALAFYGLVLFPEALGYINSKVVSFFVLKKRLIIYIV